LGMSAESQAGRDAVNATAGKVVLYDGQVAETFFFSSSGGKTANVQDTAQPKQGVDPAACEKAIYEELDKAKASLISDQELEKAKNIRLVEFYHQMRTINGRANTIGTYEIYFGDYNRLFDAAKNYSAVTKEDVQRVAAKYFGANNRTVATLIPENEEKPKQ